MRATGLQRRNRCVSCVHVGANSQSIGRRIRQARTEAGFRRGTDFAAALGLQHNTSVSRWERGHVTPGPRWLRTIAAVCGVSVDWLLTGREQPSGGEAA